MLLDVINENKMVQNWVDFVEIKFHLDENIKWQ
jgi:hypothetical protein